jgi:hypothetical protein
MDLVGLKPHGSGGKKRRLTAVDPHCVCNRGLHLIGLQPM